MKVSRQPTKSSLPSRLRPLSSFDFTGSDSCSAFNTEREAEWGSRERELTSRIRELEGLVKSDVGIRQELLAQLAQATGDKDAATAALHKAQALELKLTATIERLQKRLDTLASVALPQPSAFDV